MRQNISSMLDEAGCTSREDCFIHMYVNDPVDNIGNWIYLAELKDCTVQNNTGLRVINDNNIINNNIIIIIAFKGAV